MSRVAVCEYIVPCKRHCIRHLANLVIKILTEAPAQMHHHKLPQETLSSLSLYLKLVFSFWYPRASFQIDRSLYLFYILYTFNCFSRKKGKGGRRAGNICARSSMRKRTCPYGAAISLVHLSDTKMLISIVHTHNPQAPLHVHMDPPMVHLGCDCLGFQSYCVL